MNTLMYITPWLMRMFTNFDDWNLVLYTFDYSLRHGIAGMFRLALSIMTLVRERLLEAPEISRVLPCLLYLPPDLVTREALEVALLGISVTREHIEQIELDLKLKRRETRTSRIEEKTPKTEEDQGAGLFDRLMTPVRRHFGFTVTSTRPTASASTPARPSASRAPNSISKTTATDLVPQSPRHMSPGGVASFVEFSTPTPMRQKRRAVEGDEPGLTLTTATIPKKPRSDGTPLTTTGTKRPVITMVSPPGTEMEEREPVATPTWRSGPLNFDYPNDD